MWPAAPPSSKGQFDRKACHVQTDIMEYLNEFEVKLESNNLNLHIFECIFQKIIGSFDTEMLVKTFCEHWVKHSPAYIDPYLLLHSYSTAETSQQDSYYILDEYIFD